MTTELRLPPAFSRCIGLRRLLTSFFAIAACFTAAASAAGTTVPGQLRVYSTIRSIGMEWDLSGDSNHNATATVLYTKTPMSSQRQALPLLRVDFQGYYGVDSADRRYNMLAGSILFLDPGSDYTVWLSLKDPDGGNKDTALTISTRPIPALPAVGRTLHVAPGSGGGDGSAANPFKGLAAAQTAAQAGDIMLLHTGAYGNFSFSKSGTPSAYLVWKSAGDGDAVLDYGRIAASYVWLYGLKFVNGTGQTYALVGQSGSPRNVVTRCSFTGFNYNVTMQAGSDEWYIADNTIVGDKTDVRVVGDFDGEGVELEHTSGHTVCYNSISRVADGVSYAHRNCDIYNNDIFDVVDDGIEPDYGYANIRIWENRITNPRNHAFSFQPMNCGPWYIVRNQIMTTSAYMLKFRVVDRFVLANNTFVGWNTLDIYDQNILGALSRNNLWIQAGGSGYIWEAMSCTDASSCTQPERWSPDWRTDVDNDGFDWGASSPVFKWGVPVQRFTDLPGFSTAAGIERHGLAVNRAQLFDSLVAPRADTLYNRTHLTLKTGSTAIDKGDTLPNINDNFIGKAPDLGAYEYGAAMPVYGPRPEGSEPVFGRSAPHDEIANNGMMVSGHRGHTTVILTLKVRTMVSIAVYGFNGKRIATIANDIMTAGIHAFVLKDSGREYGTSGLVVKATIGGAVRSAIFMPTCR
jgi:hypothetical protein